MRKLTSAHILDWKRRRGEARQVSEFIALIEVLEAEWKARGDDPYLAEFIPLRLVTIIEVSMREIVAELIDHGQPFIGKADQLVRNAKLDFAFAEHLDGDRLTIGDFVAHSISVNGIDQVIGTLSGLVEDFPDKLAASFPRWKEEEADWPLPPIIENYHNTLGRLARLFEVRHVLAHELPRDPILEVSEVAGFLSATRQFIEAAEWITVECVVGSLARTQVTMNEDARQELEGRLGEMRGKVEEVKKLIGIDASKVDLVQRDWEQFADSEAAVVASNVEGGTAYPMLFAAAKAELTEDRIDQLQRIIDGWAY